MQGLLCEAGAGAALVIGNWDAAKGEAVVTVNACRRSIAVR